LKKFRSKVETEMKQLLVPVITEVRLVIITVVTVHSTITA